MRNPLRRIVELMKAEQDGRLLVLPCKVGDTVYMLDHEESCPACNVEGEVYAVSINAGTNWISVRYRSGLRFDHTWEAIGKTVFLTREAAEKALEGMK